MAGWGAATAVVAYLVSRGNLAVFVLLMAVIGIAQRVVAVRLAKRRGRPAQRWWKT